MCRGEGKKGTSTPEVDNLMLCIWVEVHVSTQLIVHTAALGVEAAVGAALHVTQALRGSEAEYATLLAAVCWGHHNGDCLLKHGLIAALSVDVNAAEKAGLQDSRVIAAAAICVINTRCSNCNQPMLQRHRTLRATGGQ